MDNAKPHGKALFALAYLVFLISILGYGLSYATVTGPCANCHTMHNSQDASPLARAGTNVGWGGSGLTGDISSEPLSHLLVTDCVGCHTATTALTIINYGGSAIPIVYNTVAPTDPLAGGNFYWVAQGGAANDAKGHNVYGISGTDANLTIAPGRKPGTCGGSCHATLADPPGGNNLERGGCQGCHVFTSHHTDRGWYRYLKGHTDSPNPGDPNAGGDGLDYVTGIGDDDWEQETVVDHNGYKGVQVAYDSHGTGLTNQQTISSFCSGCHARFHETADINANNGAPYTSPWLRHPSDIALPTTGEYAVYDPTTNHPVTGYSAEAPVGWLDPASPVRAGAVVMCISCHRVHGSDQPDLLRWDYATMDVGGGGSGGCFTCHTLKN